MMYVQTIGKEKVKQINTDDTTGTYVMPGEALTQNEMLKISVCL